MNDTALKTTVRYTGLTEEEVLKSRREFGENRLSPPKRQPWWKLLLAKFDDPVIRILIIAALISISTGEWLEGTGIILAILLATVLSFLNEFKAEKEFDILNRTSDDVPVKVIRDSNFQTIPKLDLVVGDILFVELGEEVPADGAVLEAVNLQVDQSKLTGESDPVRKISVEDARSGGVRGGNLSGIHAAARLSGGGWTRLCESQCGRRPVRDREDRRGGRGGKRKEKRR